MTHLGELGRIINDCKVICKMIFDKTDVPGRTGSFDTSSFFPPKTLESTMIASLALLP